MHLSASYCLTKRQKSKHKCLTNHCEHNISIASALSLRKFGTTIVKKMKMNISRATVSIITPKSVL